MTNTVLEEFASFQEENPEFIDLTIADTNGIIIQTENSIADAQLCKHIIDMWKNHGSTINVGEKRYIVLKSDPLQLAATKPGPGGKQIVGTSLNDKFAFSFIENGPNMNASSVYFQKWVYDKLK